MAVAAIQDYLSTNNIWIVPLCTIIGVILLLHRFFEEKGMNLYRNLFPFTIKISNLGLMQSSETSLNASIHFDLNVRPRVNIKVLEAHIEIPNWSNEKFYFTKPKIGDLVKQEPFTANHTVIIQDMVVNIDLTKSGYELKESKLLFEDIIVSNDIHLCIEVDNGWRRAKEIKFRLSKGVNN